MANQKHSAFDVYGNPFIRGASLVLDIDQNALPSASDAGLVTLGAFDVSDFDLTKSDQIFAQFQIDAVAAGASNMQFSVVLDDGTTEQPIGTFTITFGSSGIAECYLEVFISAGEDSSTPTQDVFTSIARLTYAINGNQQTPAVNVNTTYMGVGLNLATVLIKCNPLAAGNDISLSAGVLQLFGGEV